MIWYQSSESWYTASPYLVYFSKMVNLDMGEVYRRCNWIRIGMLVIWYVAKFNIFSCYVIMHLTYIVIFWDKHFLITPIYPFNSYVFRHTHICVYTHTFIFIYISAPSHLILNPIYIHIQSSFLLPWAGLLGSVFHLLDPYVLCG